MRPREVYAHGGPARFGDVELLALLLGTGTASRTALEIGAELVGRFDGLEGLARSQVQELQTVSGLGLARAVRLHAALQLGRRSLRPEVDPRTPVLDPKSAYRWLGPPLAGLPDEELHALYLDRRRRPLGHRKLSRGSDAFTVVDPRQVYRPAIGLSASAVVLAHNHPSGDPTPSPQDRDVTRRVAEAGRVLGVALVDHLVIGARGYSSLAEQGLLPAGVAAAPGWTSER